MKTELSQNLRGIAGRFLRFGVVGGAATAIHYAIVIVLVEVAAANPTFSSAIGYVVSGLLNYRVNYSFTFQATGLHRRILPRFALVSGVGLGLNTVTMYLLNGVLGVHYLLAQVCATGLALAWNFALSSVWSFREPPVRS